MDGGSFTIWLISLFYFFFKKNGGRSLRLFWTKISKNKKSVKQVFVLCFGVLCVCVGGCGGVCVGVWVCFFNPCSNNLGQKTLGNFLKNAVAIKENTIWIDSLWNYISENVTNIYFNSFQVIRDSIFNNFTKLRGHVLLPNVLDLYSESNTIRDIVRWYKYYYFLLHMEWESSYAILSNLTKKRKYLPILWYELSFFYIKR